MKAILLSFVGLVGSLAAAEKPYDFRTSESYRALSAMDQERLERVSRAFVLLWGALDMYADDHGGELPLELDDLVPRYLNELPSDPFAALELAGASTAPTAASKRGRGYRFRKGAPGNRAWILSSAGLPDFPYLAARGNVGLYVCEGTWISGMNPVLAK